MCGQGLGTAPAARHYGLNRNIGSMSRDAKSRVFAQSVKPYPCRFDGQQSWVSLPGLTMMNDGHTIRPLLRWSSAVASRGDLHMTLQSGAQGNRLMSRCEMVQRSAIACCLARGRQVSRSSIHWRWIIASGNGRQNDRLRRGTCCCPIVVVTARPPGSIRRSRRSNSRAISPICPTR
jgi:hypothetical protein